MNFKKENNTVSLPEEVNQYIKYVSEIDSQELKSKLELNDISERINFSKKQVSEFNDTFQNMIKDLQISQAGIKTKKSILDEAKNKYMTLLNSLPAKALILVDLEREAKVKNAIYLVFTQQYELAKLEESKEMEPFKILDKAYVNSKPVFPKKVTSILISLVLSFFISLFLSLFWDFFKQEKNNFNKTK
ncbi:MAG: GNVR domain-containing protein [Cyanobacteriota bacterium]|mgnify:CR=1 FL=1